LLGAAGRGLRDDALDLGEMGDDAGVDVVALLENPHRLGETAHAAWIENGAGHACQP